MKPLIKKCLARLGFEVRRILPPQTKPQGPTLFAPWDSDEKFNALYAEVQSHTLVTKIGCYFLYQLAVQAAAAEGEFAEIGVYKGGTARLLARMSSSGNKNVHLFDTFEGMPPADPLKDIHRQGDFNDTSLASVQEYLVDCKNAKFYPGFFPETADPIRSLRFSLVHIDVDIFRSVTDCCTFFYERTNPGGVLVFDDYGLPSCPGAKEAVDTFFAAKPEERFYLPTGQCVVIKL